MEDHLTLDPAIRDWVVLPLVLLVVMVGVGRHYLMLMLRTERPANAEEHKNKQTLMRSGRLRAAAKFLNPAAVDTRRAYLMRKKTGVLRQKVPGATNPMMNPLSGGGAAGGMMEMMMAQSSFMITNMLMMSVVGALFSGFVLLKIPFPLTQRFKLMLQRGVDLGTLDVSYVSSLSWYFLATFGLRGFFRLLLGDEAGADEARMMQSQMGMAAGGGQQPFDAAKAFRQERDMLRLLKHKWVADDVEKKLLGKRYPTAASSFNATDLSSLTSGGGGGASVAAAATAGSGAGKKGGRAAKEAMKPSGGNKKKKKKSARASD